MPIQEAPDREQVPPSPSRPAGVAGGVVFLEPPADISGVAHVHLAALGLLEGHGDLLDQAIATPPGGSKPTAAATRSGCWGFISPAMLTNLVRWCPASAA